VRLGRPSAGEDFVIKAAQRGGARHGSKPGALVEIGWAGRRIAVRLRAPERRAGGPHGLLADHVCRRWLMLVAALSGAAVSTCC